MSGSSNPWLSETEKPVQDMDLATLARRFDAKADMLWKLSRDYDCWGLGRDAADARQRTYRTRTAALLCRARLPMTPGEA